MCPAGISVWQCVSGGGTKKGTRTVCPLSCNESTINACARCRCSHGRLRCWPRRGRRTCRGRSCFPSTCCRLPNCHGASCRLCGHCCCGCPLVAAAHVLRTLLAVRMAAIGMAVGMAFGCIRDYASRCQSCSQQHHRCPSAVSIHESKLLLRVQTPGGEPPGQAINERRCRERTRSPSDNRPQRSRSRPRHRLASDRSSWCC